AAGPLEADAAGGSAAQGPRLVQREAAAMVRTAEAAKHLARRIGRAFRGGRHRPRWRTGQAQLDAVDVDRIPGAQQRHPAHRPAVDVDPAGTLAQLQPRTAAIDADLQARVLAAVDQAGAVRALAHGMHAGTEHDVLVAAVGESEAEGLHAAAI